MIIKGGSSTMKYRTIFSKFLAPKSHTVHADTLNTAVNAGEGMSKLDNATRIVYAKEIQFKAMPNMR